ncbi:hypothetical protein DOM21_02320 [Bacteriovorax stolpii]|uniref:transporter substrate-binding domain-containing protein n=1 Tax=Bacteriovorax stolpii TaxID=960 RepID=UPI001156EFF9|nr:transporter substrate-binding domain-containing protein [Bacteriovorax stolpii]QDK40309.1 hypothetical protein DOM21_02320 [Bacteriovorax stolpii]
MRTKLLLILLKEKVKKKFTILIFVFSIFSSTILASEKKVVISVPEEWSTGLFLIKELLKDSYNDIGYELIFVERPLSRSMIELTHNQIDGELLNSKDAAKKYNLTVVEPPYFLVKGFAYYSKKKFKNDPTINEIKKGRIGYLRGSFFADNFFSGAKSPTIVNNEKQLLLLLDRDRVDFLISMNPSFAKKEMNFGKVLLLEASIHHVISKRNSELAKRLEPALKKNMAKLKYDNLQEKVRKLILRT